MKTFGKYTIAVLISSVLFAFSSLVIAQTPERVRVAAYNIRFLNTSISQARRDNLKEVIRLLNADVIALNEIDDRPSLAQVFPPDRWQIVIDDDSGHNQDVAVVVQWLPRLYPYMAGFRESTTPQQIVMSRPYADLTSSGPRYNRNCLAAAGFFSDL